MQRQGKEKLKKTLLDMLDKDVEFRHAVAGLIGYKEILDRITSLEERVVKLEERIVALEEKVVALEERIVALEERVVKLEERVVKVEEEIKALREETNNLRRDMMEGFKRQDRRLRYIESFIENMSASLEEEAREVIAYRLKARGINLSGDLTSITLPDMEIDIYGIDTDICVVGEAKARAGTKAIIQVERSIARLCKRYPQYVRPRIIKVVYAIQVPLEAIREAENRSIWVVTPSKDLTPLIVVEGKK
ncbi:MAG: hypothetical protein NZ888_03420 [Candidatus Nitrosocaldus sp.]|nr:hypothetical protein [Candidatus Nitrosocaldus sp.]MDW8000175.1 hypothetical protein [Candidatus Nitrosocaldus sp.]